MPLEHWMMFSTFAEQNYFVYPNNNSYSGVIINANMAAHAPSGLASFIMGKLSGHTKYIVDPFTHAFQHDPSYIKNGDRNVKKSIKLLADKYGPPISDYVGDRPLGSSDFLSNEIVTNFTRKVLDFQRDHLHDFMASSDEAKYLEESEIKKPAAIIAPYFFLPETDWEGWLNTNLSCINAAIGLCQDEEHLFAEIVIDRGVLLDPKILKKIIEGYRQFSPRIHGCLLWIDNFDEQIVSITELSSMKNICASLRTIFPEVINLHGGYFSILLGSVAGRNCMTGVTHGPEFGEFRSVVPVGGGIPISRYYVPRLHSRVRYREALDIFKSAGWLNSSNEFHENVCDCLECRETIAGDPTNFIKFGQDEVKNVRRGMGLVRIGFPTSETKSHCLRHYLQRKNREYQMADGAQPQVLLDELSASIRDYEPRIGHDGVSHLHRWCQAL
jgi:hypothetical protein